MKITLTVIKRKGKKKVQALHYDFNSVTQAYRYYLKHFSTIGEWVYYLRCAHTLLNTVTNEEIMRAVFRNVFSTACITEDKKN